MDGFTKKYSVKMLVWYEQPTYRDVSLNAWSHPTIGYETISLPVDVPTVVNWLSIWPMQSARCGVLRLPNPVAVTSRI